MRELFRLLGQRGVLEILLALDEGGKFWVDFHRKISPASATTLARQLHALEDFGLVARSEVFVRGRRRKMYWLTAKGVEFVRLARRLTPAKISSIRAR